MFEALKAGASQKSTKYFNEMLGWMSGVSGVVIFSLYFIKDESVRYCFINRTYAANIVFISYIIGITIWALRYIKRNFPFIYRCVITRARMMGRIYLAVVFYPGVMIIAVGWIWMFSSQYSSIVAGFFDNNQLQPVMDLMGLHIFTFMIMMFLYFMCIADRRGISLSRTPGCPITSNKASPSEAMMPSSNRSYDAGTRL